MLCSSLPCCDANCSEFTSCSDKGCIRDLGVKLCEASMAVLRQVHRQIKLTTCFGFECLLYVSSNQLFLIETRENKYQKVV